MDNIAMQAAAKNAGAKTNPATQAPPEFKTPFDHIALAFSGGGFRAAAYALGVLSYLDQVVIKELSTENIAESPLGSETTLLKKVTYMSSASGGTIATALYALYNVKAKTFGEYYKKMADALSGEDLLTKALSLLNNARSWKSKTKNRNIINAFAVAYDTYLFDEATVKDLKTFETTSVKPKTHLEEVCFNTTDFFRGTLFKQQIKLKPDNPDEWFKYGSSFLYLEHNDAERLKLGDLLAASSCFPAGFEPIVFPDDFADDKIEADELAKQMVIVPQSGDKDERELKDNRPKIGMMDGGITDNQGLESMMSGDERRRRSNSVFKPFDLMIVSDVGSNFMTPYTPPMVRPNFFNSLFNLTAVILLFVFILSACFWKAHILSFPMACTICFSWVMTGYSCISGLAAMFCAGSLLVILGGGVLLYKFLKNMFSTSISGGLMSYLNKVSFYILYKMINARVSSIVTLTTEVFLKRVRQLLYNQFYNSPVWKNRGKGNHIYDLAFSCDISRKNHTDEEIKMPELSRELQKVAETAFSMGTTLWFAGEDVTKYHQLGCIIACGQFTTCYNLLEYILRLEKSDVYAGIPENYKLRITEIKKKLESDFEHFKEKPFYLYNQLGNDYKMRNFTELQSDNIPFPDNFAGLK